MHANLEKEERSKMNDCINALSFEIKSKDREMRSVIQEKDQELRDIINTKHHSTMEE